MPKLQSLIAARLLPVGLAALAAAPLAWAGDSVFWSIGVAPAPGVFVGASNAPATVVVPAPVRVKPTPQPVYVTPYPVYVRPAPQVVYGAPAAVYVQPPAYLVYPEPAFVPPGHQRHGHRHWQRGRGHDREPGHGHREGRWHAGDDRRS